MKLTNEEEDIMAEHSRNEASISEKIDTSSLMDSSHHETAVVDIKRKCDFSSGSEDEMPFSCHKRKKIRNVSDDDNSNTSEVSSKTSTKHPKVIDDSDDENDAKNNDIEPSSQSSAKSSSSQSGVVKSNTQSSVVHSSSQSSVTQKSKQSEVMNDSDDDVEPSSQSSVVKSNTQSSVVHSSSQSSITQKSNRSEVMNNSDDDGPNSQSSVKSSNSQSSVKSSNSQSSIVKSNTQSSVVRSSSQFSVTQKSKHSEVMDNSDDENGNTGPSSQSSIKSSNSQSSAIESKTQSSVVHPSSQSSVAQKSKILDDSSEEEDESERKSSEIGDRISESSAARTSEKDSNLGNSDGSDDENKEKSSSACDPDSQSDTIKKIKKSQILDDSDDDDVKNDISDNLQFHSKKRLKKIRISDDSDDGDDTLVNNNIVHDDDEIEMKSHDIGNELQSRTNKKLKKARILDDSDDDDDIAIENNNMDLGSFQKRSEGFSGDEGHDSSQEVSDNEQIFNSLKSGKLSKFSSKKTEEKENKFGKLLQSRKSKQNKRKSSKINQPMAELNDGLEGLEKDMNFNSDIFDAEGTDDENGEIIDDPIPDLDFGDSDEELVKSKKKKAPKPKKEKKESRKAREKALLEIHSESQRLLRETAIQMPYHKAPQQTLEEFLNRRRKKGSLPLDLKPFRSNTEHVLAVEETLKNDKHQEVGTDTICVNLSVPNNNQQTLSSDCIDNINDTKSIDTIVNDVMQDLIQIVLAETDFEYVSTCVLEKLLDSVVERTYSMALNPCEKTEISEALLRNYNECSELETLDKTVESESLNAEIPDNNRLLPSYLFEDMSMDQTKSELHTIKQKVLSSVKSFTPKLSGAPGDFIDLDEDSVHPVERDFDNFMHKFIEHSKMIRKKKIPQEVKLNIVSKDETDPSKLQCSDISVIVNIDEEEETEAEKPGIKFLRLKEQLMNEILKKKEETLIKQQEIEKLDEEIQNDSEEEAILFDDDENDSETNANDNDDDIGNDNIVDSNTNVDSDEDDGMAGADFDDGDYEDVGDDDSSSLPFSRKRKKNIFIDDEASDDDMEVENYEDNSGSKTKRRKSLFIDDASYDDTEVNDAKDNSGNKKRRKKTLFIEDSSDDDTEMKKDNSESKHSSSSKNSSTSHTSFAGIFPKNSSQSNVDPSPSDQGVDSSIISNSDSSCDKSLPLENGVNTMVTLSEKSSYQDQVVSVTDKHQPLSVTSSGEFPSLESVFKSPLKKSPPLNRKSVEDDDDAHSSGSRSKLISPVLFASSSDSKSDEQALGLQSKRSPFWKMGAFPKDSKIGEESTATGDNSGPQGINVSRVAKELQFNASPPSTCDVLDACSGIFSSRPLTAESDDEDIDDSVNESQLSSVSQPIKDDDFIMENGKSLKVDNENDSSSDADDVAEAEEDKNRPKNETKNVTDFFEDEAELSGSDVGSDVDEDAEDGEYEEDFIPNEELPSDDELRDQIGKVHLKQVLDEDKRQLRLYQELYLEDGELHTDGAGRQRKFTWYNSQGGGDFFGDRSDNSGSEQEDNPVEEQWRIERHERQKFLQEQHSKGLLIENSPSQLRRNNSFKIEILNKSQEQITVGEKEVPQLKIYSSRDTKISRASFLARGDDYLNGLTKKFKKTSDDASGSKTTKHFVFRTVSPGKVQPVNSTSPSVSVKKSQKSSSNKVQKTKKRGSIFDLLD